MAGVVGSRLAIAYLGSGPRTHEIRSQSTLAHWVLDMKAAEIVVHHKPGPEGYARLGALSAGEVALPGLDARLAVTELLPPY